METYMEQYYIESASCATNNRKLEALSEILLGYKHCLVKFSDGFMPEDMERQLRGVVKTLNEKYRSKEIKVQFYKLINKSLCFSFQTVPSTGDSTVGLIRLSPVFNVIAG